MTAYSFYITSFLGDSIPESDWPRVERRAAEKLETLKRAYTLTPIIENADDMATCALADAVNYYETAVSGGLFQSSSIGSVSSSSGGVAVDTSKAAQETEYLDCIRPYFDVYKGVRRRWYR